MLYLIVKGVLICLLQLMYSFVYVQLPPIRNSLEKKKKKKVTKPSDSTVKPPRETRIHGYDYRAWDKFDVVSTV